ncbi:MAG: Mur ligase family protein [bacterium]|nr:Mur ligase family protein [bacterium]
MRKLKKLIKVIIPEPLLRRLLSFYHLSLAYMGAVLYRHPARKLLVIGITGTKGKSSTAEMLNAIFEEAGRLQANQQTSWLGLPPQPAGHTTAVLNSIRIKTGAKSEPNLMRMTMPGRFFIQKFLSDAVNAQCTVAILEMTSQGAAQHRHRFIDMDALIFTNLAPEHIESHGSYEAYADAKFEIGREFVRSRKRPRVMVANADDKEGARYLALAVESALPISLSACKPWSADEHGGHFNFDGLDISINLPGEFSLKNALAAATTAQALGIQSTVIMRALGKIRTIPGRAETIEAGQNFTVVVDYAHTPDSLEALYRAYGKRRKICVLGATGGGRDRWKRKVMGGIADASCDEIILTNEDPYDENPRAIVDEVASGMSSGGGSASGGEHAKLQIIMGRREAIRRALSLAREGDAVLITGKGTDPSICSANGEQTPWSDAGVAREELEILLKAKDV